ncbi:hypothetical protein DITRI_Ditri18aG0074800 [Diplodiscus trichospermus]
MKKEVVLPVVTMTAATIVAVVAPVRHYWKKKKDRQWRKSQRLMRKFARECATPVPKLWQVANAMVSDTEASLSSSHYTTSSLNMELYDYIAAELAKFILAHPENNDEISSKDSLPCHIQRTKGVKELITEINQALEKHGLNMRVYALVDDTVGNLAGSRYYNKDTVAAITLGMGTNASYVDTVQSAPRWQGSLPKKGEIVISMDWGNFNSCHLPITQYDASLDAESSNPGCRIFEKLISGMYLGEIPSSLFQPQSVSCSLLANDSPLSHLALTRLDTSAVALFDIFTTQTTIDLSHLSLTSLSPLSISQVSAIRGNDIFRWFIEALFSPLPTKCLMFCADGLSCPIWLFYWLNVYVDFCVCFWFISLCVSWHVSLVD